MIAMHVSRTDLSMEMNYFGLLVTAREQEIRIPMTGLRTRSRGLVHQLNRLCRQHLTIAGHWLPHRQPGLDEAAANHPLKLSNIHGFCLCAWKYSIHPGNQYCRRLGNHLSTRRVTLADFK